MLAASMLVIGLVIGLLVGVMFHSGLVTDFDRILNEVEAINKELAEALDKRVPARDMLLAVRSAISRLEKLINE